MADDENAAHNASDGTQWEIGKANLSSSVNKLYTELNVDAEIADEYTHHAWQELSNKKQIRTIDEAKAFISADTKNSKAWFDLGIENILNGQYEEMQKKLYADINADDSGNLKKPISTFSLVKAAANYAYDDAKSSSDQANSDSKKANKEKQDYNDYLEQYKRSDDYYKKDGVEVDCIVAHCSKADDVQKEIDKYKQYDSSVGWDTGGLSVTTTDSGIYVVSINSHIQAEIYNATEAVRKAKAEAERVQNENILSAKRNAALAKKAKAEEKQRLAVRLNSYKSVAADNDSIRAAKARIEQARYEDESKIAQLEKDEQAKIDKAKAQNEKAADDWEKKFKKKNPNASAEEIASAKQDYLDSENKKSEAKIKGETAEKKKQAVKRTSDMDSSIEAASPVSDTAELYSSQQQQSAEGKATGSTKKKFNLGSALSKALSVLNDAKNGNLLSKLTGKLKGGSLGLSNLLNSVSKNNPKLMKALSKYGLRNGLLDNVLSDALKTAAAFGDSMLKSAIEAGMSWAYQHVAENGYDDYIKGLVQGLAYTGGDPNYNGTFLKIILEADYPHCLEYLDEYNGIKESDPYTLDKTEYKRGMTAAKNGAFNVAKYVCDKLYIAYKTYHADGSETAQEDKAKAVVAEIRKIFNAVVSYSYSNFKVTDLKKWLDSESNGGFGSILNPSMLGYDDPTCFGKYKITDAEINKIAPIVNITVANTSDENGIQKLASFSATSGLTLNGNGSSGSVNQSNFTKTEKYIDLRNSNFKQIYCNLVGSDYAKPDRMTNKPLYKRLTDYKVLDALTKAMSKMYDTMNKSDTMKDLTYIANSVVRATIHNTLTLMDKNNLILKAKDAKSTSFVADDTTPPAFEDYSHSDIIYHGNGGTTSTGEDSYKQSDVTNNKAIGLSNNKFTKSGFVFYGWSENAIDDQNVSESSIKYKNNEKVTIYDDLNLYALWKVKESSSESGEESGSGSSSSESNASSSSTTVRNSKTKDELDSDSDDIIAKTVKLPSAFTKAGISLKDIKALDSNGLSSSDLSAKISSLSIEGFTNHFEDKSLIKYSALSASYDSSNENCLHPFKTYMKSEPSSELSDDEKKTIVYYTIAAHLVKEYASEYSVNTISGFFGTTTFINTYKTDDDGTKELDDDGNYIILSVKKVNTPDSDLKEALEAFKEAAEKIKANYVSAKGSSKYRVEFDLCGIAEDMFEEENPELVNGFETKAYSSIYKYKPINPYQKGFVFKGWSTDPLGGILWDWYRDTITDNTTLYAIWTLSENYIKSINIPKSKNPTVAYTVYGTIDEENKLILFPMKLEELPTDKRFFFKLSLPYGCTSDVSETEKILMRPADETVSGDIGYGEDITITDSDNQEKTYSLKFVTIPTANSKLAFLSDGGTLNKELTSEDLSTNEGKINSANLPACTKSGYEFKNWKNSLGETVDGEMSLVTSSMDTFESVYEEKIYTVTYKDKADVDFTGTHGSDPVETIKYSKSYKLDTPTRSGYVFKGYYLDMACEGKAVKVLNRYNYTDNVVLYAKWISIEEEAATSEDGITIDGVTIDLTNTIFYNTLIFDNGETWSISTSGINAYSSSGTFLRRMRVGGSVYIPLGLTFSKDGNSVIAIVRHRTRNDDSAIVYFTKDKGITLEKAFELEEIDVPISETALSQSVGGLSFYKTIIYQDHTYSIAHTKKSYRIVCDDEYILMTSYTTGVKATQNKVIEGLSVTVSGDLYVLFTGCGVIKFTGWTPIFGDDGIPELEDFDDESGSTISQTKRRSDFTSDPVAGYISGFYNVDNENIGFPENSTRQPVLMDDDIDLTDADAIARVNEYNRSKYKYIKTFEKAGNSEDNVFEELWKWSWGISKAGVILSKNSYIIENMGKFRPTTAKERKLIKFETASNSIYKAINKTDDVEVIRKVQMTEDNCQYYIGWTRVIYKENGTDILETIKITKDYLEEQGILDGSFEELWYIKYTRTELILKTITNAVGEEVSVNVYNSPNIEKSSIFQKYLRFGKI